MPLEQSIPYGFCHCGCGKTTTIPTITNNSLRRYRGIPMLFISGHNRVKKRTNAHQLGSFKIDNVYCRLIPLTKGLWAIVDASDFEWLMQWRWCARWDNDTRTHYAGRTDCTDGERAHVVMHRLILGLNEGDKRQGDHIYTGNGLDNRRNNLRVATRSEQSMNRRARRFTHTGLKGVSYRKATNTYVASIRIKGKSLNLGETKDPHKAHLLYAQAAHKYFGSFARTK